MRPRSRYLAAGVLVLLAVGWPVLVTPFTPDGSDRVAAEVVLTFTDDAIDESSGLVVDADRLFTVNDSGDGPFLYEVDRATGGTTGITTFDTEDPVDVEALAPGRGGTVWVGDIGDNARARESITLHRFRPVPGGGSVASTRFGLRYPEGPRDAEALLVHPGSGRVVVVTKGLLGGEVYLAPPDLDPGAVHRLEQVGTVPGMVTDGAFLPGGRHLVLRTYGTAGVYSYPGLDQLVSFELPEQEQGEAVAVGPDGRIYLSTEGERSDVLVMDLPPVPQVSPRPRSPDASAGTDPDPTEPPDPASAGTRGGDGERAADDRGGFPTSTLAATVGGALAGLLIVLAVRASRRRGRRRP